MRKHRTLKTICLALIVLLTVFYTDARGDVRALKEYGAIGNSTGPRDPEGLAAGWANGPCFIADGRNGLFLRQDGGRRILIKKGLFLSLTLRSGWLYYVDATPKPITGILRYALCRMNLETGSIETVARRCICYDFVGDKLVYRAGYDGVGYVARKRSPPKDAEAIADRVYMAEPDGSSPVELFKDLSYTVFGTRLLLSDGKENKPLARMGSYETTSGECAVFTLPENVASVDYVPIGGKIYCCYCITDPVRDEYYRGHEAFLRGEPPLATFHRESADMWLTEYERGRLSPYVHSLNQSIGHYTACQVENGYRIFPLEDGYAVYDKPAGRWTVIPLVP